jgi:predicted NBD/HSP70 family sugar kinase
LKYSDQIIDIKRFLFFERTATCLDLSLKIQKSLPVTTRLVNELLEAGDIAEIGQGQSTGGRRPARYAIVADSSYIVSVALDQFVARIAMIDMHGQMVSGIDKINLTLQDNEEALAGLTKFITAFIKNSGIQKSKILGIGIGMPGFVDAQKGINYSFLKTADASITDIVSRATRLPVMIDNDSSLIALAELRFGTARKKLNSMVVNIGWGIGLGMIVNGELFRGHRGFAGELSHIPIFTNGKLCGCGKTGCLETETSLQAISIKAAEQLKAGRVSVMQGFKAGTLEDDSDILIQAAHDGDRLAVELFSEAGYNIGRALAIMIHLINPELVVLSGRGARAGKVWFAPIMQAMNEHCIPRLAEGTSIELSGLGHDAELIGAASLVMENYVREIKNNSREKTALA